jgi:hypothetical protein
MNWGTCLDRDPRDHLAPWQQDTTFHGVSIRKGRKTGTYTLPMHFERNLTGPGPLVEGSCRR